MKDFFCSTEFTSGIISGIVLSLIIWAYRWIVGKIHIIRATLPDIHTNKIEIHNVSLLGEISNIKIVAQVSYNGMVINENMERKTMINHHAILVEDEKSYITPWSKKGLYLSDYCCYILKGNKICTNFKRKPRKLKLDFSQLNLGTEVPIETISDFINPKNGFEKVFLHIYIYYHGKISNIYKYREEKIPIVNG